MSFDKTEVRSAYAETSKTSPPFRQRASMFRWKIRTGQVMNIAEKMQTLADGNGYGEAPADQTIALTRIMTGITRWDSRVSGRSRRTPSYPGVTEHETPADP